MCNAVKTQALTLRLQMLGVGLVVPGRNTHPWTCTQCVLCRYLPRLMGLPIGVWRAGGNGNHKGDPLDGKSNV